MEKKKELEVGGGPVVQILCGCSVGSTALARGGPEVRRVSAMGIDHRDLPLAIARSYSPSQDVGTEQ